MEPIVKIMVMAGVLWLLSLFGRAETVSAREYEPDIVLNERIM